MDDHEDSLWFGDDDDDDEEPGESRPPRLFAILWSAISQWVTPPAVAYVCQLVACDDNATTMSSPPAYDTTDIGASRCAGLQALLKMHCRKCWREDLAQDVSQLRMIEQRLGDLLRCFDYGQPSPKLNTAQAKALTCVLLDIVANRTDSALDKNDAVPSCCAEQGMTLDEYSYLTRSAINNFGASF
jgi:hypothetical protein